MAEFTEDEATDLVSMFSSMGVKPDTRDSDAMMSWMYDFLESKGKIKTESTQRSYYASPAAGGQQPTFVTQNPRISLFSGDTKGDHVSYDMWRFEVWNLLKEKLYSNEVITMAAKKSLRGEAAKVSMRLGVFADIQELIDKFDGIYGNIDATEDLLAKFYSAQQKEDESVVNWGCRLEEMLDKVKQGNALNMSPREMNEILRSKFWAGLRPQLKDASRYKCEQLETFDELLVALRKIEQDLSSRTTTQKVTKPQVKMAVTTEKEQPQVKMAVTAEKEQPLGELKGMIEKLTKKVEDLENKTQKSSEQYRHSSRRGRGGYQQHFSGTRGNYTPPTHPSQSAPQNFGQQPEPTCFKCGQPGHIKRGCRVDLSKLGHLNVNPPTLQGQR